MPKTLQENGKIGTTYRIYDILYTISSIMYRSMKTFHLSVQSSEGMNDGETEKGEKIKVMFL